MLDRYTISLNADELELVLGREVPSNYEPQFNAAPTKKLPVITALDKDKINIFNWGLMSSWSNNKAMSPKFFNLHIDSVLSKNAYRKKIEKYRCVIPMDGFYLWKQIAKKKQTPFYFTYTDRRFFLVAGIWEATDEQNAFTIILKNANTQIEDYQEDMPLILDPGHANKWLEAKNSDEISSILQNNSGPDDFIFHTVSPNIKDLEKNHISLINPAPASDQHGNYTLFS